MKVRKRDKTIEQYQLSKIRKAIASAFESCKDSMQNESQEDAIDSVLNCIKEKYNEEEDRIVDVEDIQDDVENCLMESYPLVA